MRLEQIIQQSITAEPKLAQKLIALAKWIKDKKDGLLMSKPYVLDLLTEVISDADLWVALRPLSDEERRQFYASESFSVTERYWLEVLFPRWLHDQDPKFPTWKREVMNGNFKRDDEPMLRGLAREIEGRGGSYLWRHLLDLSMATDLLASGQKANPLCVQLTTVAEPYLASKQRDWEATLAYWSIKRGLLISYNPTENLLMSRLITAILSYSDAPTVNGYNVITNL